MDPTGIVAQHAAERAVRMGRWVWPEDQPVLGRLMLQAVEDDARLDARNLPLRVDAHHAVDVLRHIHDDRDVAALPREARAATARQNRRAVLPADANRRDHVVHIPRDDDANGHLPIVGAVGRIQRAAAAIESHLAAARPAKIVGKIGVESPSRRAQRIGGQGRSRHSRVLQIIPAPPTTRPSIIARCSFAQVCGLTFAVRAANRPCAP